MTKDFQVASNGNSEHCAAPTPIAIIGMACRFAGGANSPSDLWKLCAEGTDVWSPIPKQRFAGNSWHDPDPHKQGKVWQSAHITTSWTVTQGEAVRSLPSLPYSKLRRKFT